MTTTTTLVTGNTYPVKDQIKALGGRWDADARGWRVPSAKAAEAQALVASAPAPTTRRGNGRRVSRAQWQEDYECELCGKNKYKCGHCIGW